MSGHRAKPTCAGVKTWLKLNGLPLGALTGTDTRALAVAVHAVELYSYGGGDRALIAFRAAVEAMQPSTREVAFHSVAYSLDWPDRARLWRLAGLEPLPAPLHRLTGER